MLSYIQCIGVNQNFSNSQVAIIVHDVMKGSHRAHNMVRADDIVRASQHCKTFMTLQPSTHFKVHPLALHLQDHLNDLQDVGEGALPVIHFLLEGLHVA